MNRERIDFPWLLRALLLPGVAAVLPLLPCRADDAVHLESIPVSYDHAILYEEGKQDAGTEPIALGPGPHLLLDDYLIASTSNLVRSVEGPKRSPDIPNPVVTGPEDGCFQPYLSVLRDEKTGRFRIWYGHRTEDKNAGRSLLGYMESADGIHFERPARTLEVPDEIQFGVAVIDDGADSADLSKRFKYGWYLNDGLRVAASPDGLTWTSLAPGSVLLHNHDINGIFRDPIRGRYVAIASVYREGGPWEGQRRITMQAHSEDLIHWSAAHHVVLPVPSREEGEVQFYAMDGFLARGDLLIGMVKVLRDDLKADDPPNPEGAYGTGYTALAWSHDGETWVRDPAPFFERDLDPNAWDHSHTWIDEQVLVGDDLFLYYGGYAHGHKVNRFEERQIGLVKIRRDRYVGWKAGGTGTLRTRLVTLDSVDLRVNVKANGGSLRVRVLGEDGKPMPGFDFDDGKPVGSDVPLSPTLFPHGAMVKGDNTEAPIAWSTPADTLKGKRIRFEFELNNATLYGFYL